MKRSVFLAITVALFALDASGASTGARITGGALIAPAPGGGGGGSSCTDGLDCYCDIETTSVSCEDFESAGFYAGTAANYWAATSTGSGNRGDESYWYTNYGNGDGVMFRNTDPSPTLDQACTAGSQCVGTREYCSAAQGALVGASTDCWGPGSNTGACIDAQREGDVDVENGLTLTGGAGAAADVGGGNTHMLYRIPAGSTCGILGTKSLGGARTEVGVTMALAFASNLGSSLLLKNASEGAAEWKFDEWGNGSSGAFIEHWNLGNTGAGTEAQFPYRGFMWVASGGNNSTCNSYVSAATVEIGSMTCDPSGNVRFGADTDLFQKDRDFPDGTWHCAQAHITGMGTSDMAVKYWHDGTLIFWMHGLDSAAVRNKNYTFYAPNAYANNNSGLAGYRDTTVTTGRYQDNIHVEPGPPVACADIGF